MISHETIAHNAASRANPWSLSEIGWRLAKVPEKIRISTLHPPPLSLALHANDGNQTHIKEPWLKTAPCCSIEIGSVLEIQQTYHVACECMCMGPETTLKSTGCRRKHCTPAQRRLKIFSFRPGSRFTINGAATRQFGERAR
jgi:hypothetical protein